MPQAFAYFGRSMALADELGLEHLLLLPLNLIGRALCAIGRYREGADLLARGIELAERFGDRELLAGSLAFYASSFWLQGDPEAGAPHAARAMALAEELGHPSRIAANCMTLGFFYAFSGRFDEATDYLERCLAIVDETEDLHPLYTAHGCLGYVHLQRGDYPLAAHHLDQCLRLAGESAQLTTHLPMYQAFQAELWWREGRTDEALALAESALRLAEETRQPMAQGLVRQSLAWLHLNPPDPAPDRALALLNEGLSLYEAENARPFAAVCSWQLARTHHALGDHAAAQRLLSQAQAEFEALGMTWHRRQAGNLALPAD